MKRAFKLMPCVLLASGLAQAQVGEESRQLRIDGLQERVSEARSQYEDRLKGDQLKIENRLFGSDAKAKSLRSGVLDYLGIRPEQGTLYVFVSSSMPKPMIESYLNEGVWSGAIVVVRGIPDGQNLGDWTRDWYSPMAADGKTVATLTIDPVLFDQYGVDVVPTIIWDESPDRLIGGDCQTVTVQRSAGQNQSKNIETCEAFDSSGFFRVSGAVTTQYALEQFSSSGAKGAEERLKKMKDYFTHGSTQAQTEYGSEWEGYLSGEGRARIDRMQAAIRGMENAQMERMEPLFPEDQSRADLFSNRHYGLPDVFKPDSGTTTDE